MLSIPSHAVFCLCALFFHFARVSPYNVQQRTRDRAVPGDRFSGQSKLSAATEFKNALVVCQQNFTLCSTPMHMQRITNLGSKLANEFSVLLLHEGIDDLFKEALSFLPRDHPSYMRVSHIRSIVQFSQGYTAEAQMAWKIMGGVDLSAKRSLAIQMIIIGQETAGFQKLGSYCDELITKFQSILNASVASSGNSTQVVVSRKSPSSPESEELLLSMFLNEVQGGVHTMSKSSDLILCLQEFRPIDAEQRFRLGVGLAKLGLFDLSLRHVSMSATPWESPIYTLRARLVFQPIHSSVRALAMSVDNFEFMAESILAEGPHHTSIMEQNCISLNQISMVIQALPLLHLAGYSSPRDELVIGHSALALPALLSEVYISLCQIQPLPENLVPAIPMRPVDEEFDSLGLMITTRVLRIGFVSGSFDGLAGKITLAMITPGLVESIEKSMGVSVVLTAMCLPTPRSVLTDMVNTAFRYHINLPPENKTECVKRIRNSNQDLLIFSDAGLDSRVFALAHERMAPLQAILWGWGGTLGIPTIDYYFVPAALWDGSACSSITGSEVASYSMPQDLFHEQVVLLDEIPLFPLGQLAPADDLHSVMKNRFRLPPLNESHVYLFPGSVRYLHPEFDEALKILLNTDLKSYVIVTLPRTGRDGLPTTHLAGRHDLMHPTHPPAAVEKLKTRLKEAIGVDAASRIRILPPLEEPIFSMLLLHVTAVLDPYPVGMHISITEAMMRGVPVVSAPKMQECTNSHAYGIAQTLGIRGPGWNRNEWPANAEEYAVLAMQLQLDKSLRNNFLPPMNRNNLWSNPNGHKYRGLQMIVEVAVRLAL